MTSERRQFDGGTVDGLAIRIRAALPTDAEQVAEIVRTLAEYEDYSLLTVQEAESRHFSTVDQLLLEASAGHTGNYVAVAEAAGRVVGVVDLTTLGLERCSHVVELGIGVLPRYTNRGIGSALLRHALNWARDRGFSKVRLLVIETNTRARHVYRKLGFRESGRYLKEVRTVRGYVDLLVMERFLR